MLQAFLKPCVAGSNPAGGTNPQVSQSHHRTGDDCPHFPARRRPAPHSHWRRSTRATCRRPGSADPLVAEVVRDLPCTEPCGVQAGCDQVSEGVRVQALPRRAGDDLPQPGAGVLGVGQRASRRGEHPRAVGSRWCRRRRRPEASPAPGAPRCDSPARTAPRPRRAGRVGRQPPVQRGARVALPSSPRSAAGSARGITACKRPLLGGAVRPDDDGPHVRLPRHARRCAHAAPLRRSRAISRRRLTAARGLPGRARAAGVCGR
jgi:hypothetical protein